MEFNELFNKVKAKSTSADISQIHDKLAIQIDITGSNEESGTFYIEVKDGVLSVEPYDYHDRNVKIIVSSETFLKIMQKQLDPILAFTIGKLKAEGDLGKAAELSKFI